MSDSQLLQEQAEEIMEIIEGVVENYCYENIVRGEKIWTMINALSVINLRQFPDVDDDEFGVDYVLIDDNEEDEYDEEGNNEGGISDAW